MIDNLLLTRQLKYTSCTNCNWTASHGLEGLMPAATSDPVRVDRSRLVRGGSVWGLVGGW